MLKQLLPGGRLEISEDVIFAIIVNCIQQLEGIKIISDLKEDVQFFFKKSYYRGMVIRNSDKDYSVKIKIELTNMKNVNVVQLCYTLQQLINEKILDMTGIKIKNINIYIEKISSS